MSIQLFVYVGYETPPQFNTTTTTHTHLRLVSRCSGSQIPFRKQPSSKQRNIHCVHRTLKAKFHQLLVGSTLVRSWFEPDSVMEFGFQHTSTFDNNSLYGLQKQDTLYKVPRSRRQLRALFFCQPVAYSVSRRKKTSCVNILSLITLFVDCLSTMQLTSVLSCCSNSLMFISQSSYFSHYFLL